MTYQQERTKKLTTLGLCVVCAKNPLVTKLYCMICKNTKSAYERNRDKELRLKAFEMYGGQICTCCGETQYEFLCIDHINGGGNQHRTLAIGDKKCAGSKMCRWLKTNNYPEGYQVLCHNCNMAKGFYGYCPHTKKVLEQAA